MRKLLFGVVVLALLGVIVGGGIKNFGAGDSNSRPVIMGDDAEGAHAPVVHMMGGGDGGSPMKMVNGGGIRSTISFKDISGIRSEFVDMGGGIRSSASFMDGGAIRGGGIDGTVRLKTIYFGAGSGCQKMICGPLKDDLPL